MTSLYRQGDVLLIPTQIPEGDYPEVPSVDGFHILALGEATGHRHKVPSSQSELFAPLDRTPTPRIQNSRQVVENADGLLLRIKEACQLTHEEHNPVELPAGDYQVRIQREYTPEAIRMVAD